MSESTARGSAIYAAYIKSRLDDQDARKSSIEQRGIAVITTSGTLTTLLFALVALLTGTKDYKLPPGAEPWIFGALIAFVLAAVGGISVNAPLRYWGVKIEDLQKAVTHLWQDSAADAEKRVAVTQLKELGRAKKLNTVKGYILLGAVVIEVLAVISLALAIRVILVNG